MDEKPSQGAEQSMPPRGSQMSSGAKVLASVLSFFGLLVGTAIVGVAATSILNVSNYDRPLVGILFGVLFWVTWAIVLRRIWRRPA